MLKNILLILLAAFCNVFAQLSIKKASQSNLFGAGLIFETIVNILNNYYVWIGIILYFISFILSIKIYEMFELSVISPIFIAVVLVILLFVSNFALNESVSSTKILGTIIIIIGIFIITR